MKNTAEVTKQAQEFLKRLSINKYLETPIYSRKVINLMRHLQRNSFYIIENLLVPPFIEKPTLTDLDNLVLALNKEILQQNLIITRSDRYANHILDTLIEIQKQDKEKEIANILKTSQHEFELSDYLDNFTMTNGFVPIGDQPPLRLILEAQNAKNVLNNI
ncbi:hypothetical protein FC89_GL000235 [Liquorilactobacillus ghanensis DSM 18630]|uniref:Uncharacterized protein n=1 Tax=Liquorilactobacillus ghanensis DSM 18630 TaxID=1423750 RepID=A0A0R1W007_9LACO|nr:hypothetical protein [Liquorilactobacillus ghanensis]KRM07548.1 hypothetical protein FC89_GL000235 [Liquorilactobacillus ghanensis DSM 18630]